MKTSDGTSPSYAELPIPTAHLYWTRGDAKLIASFKDDPAAFLGGWSASFQNKEGDPSPVLPLPVVDRVSADGKVVYKKYAANYIYFIPLQHRFRYELKTKVIDPNSGREYEKCSAVSKEKIPGYVPNRQVFGLVYNKDLSAFAPAVLHINKWNSFISFERAGQAWNKIDKSTPEEDVLVRRYGTIGVKSGDTITPNFEVYGESRSTPIEAIGTGKPAYIKATAEIEKLILDSADWATCERWNAEGRVEEEPVLLVAEKEFHSRCDEIGISNIEADQILQENGGDAIRALAALDGDTINQALAEGESF